MSFDAQPRFRRRETCDRCGVAFEDGYRWSSLGIPLSLCKECTEDVEESAASYGEKGEAAKRRFLSRLRSIGMDGPARRRA